MDQCSMIVGGVRCGLASHHEGSCAPSTTVCSACNHPVAFHGSPAGCRAHYRVTDPICGCKLHPNARPKPADEPKRCRAEYEVPDGENLRCEILNPPETTHVGVEDHVATVDGGHPVRWTETVALYPHREVGRFVQEAYESLVPVPVPASERQVGGDHYRKFKIQPWDIWEAYSLDAFTGAIIKYLLRDKGNRLEDLKKARHTLDKLIEIEEGK